MERETRPCDREELTKRRETFSLGEQPPLSHEKGRRLKIPVSFGLLRLVERGNDSTVEGKPWVLPLQLRSLDSEVATTISELLVEIAAGELLPTTNQGKARA